MEASQNVRNLLTGTITNAPHIPRGAAFLDSGDMIRNPVHVFEKYRARLGPTFTFHLASRSGQLCLPRRISFNMCCSRTTPTTRSPIFN